MKMETQLLNDMDSTLKSHRYSTRTEFIRDAIRSKLTALEKEDALKKLTEYQGKFKGQFKHTDEEAGRMAMEDMAKKFNIKLD